MAEGGAPQKMSKMKMLESGMLQFQNMRYHRGGILVGDVAGGDIARRMRMEKVAGRKQWRISMEQEKCCDLVIIDFFVIIHLKTHPPNNILKRYILCIHFHIKILYLCNYFKRFVYCYTFYNVI